jgi:hypothetical protein
MYFVYDLRQDGFVVYTGLTADPGRSLARHLALGRRFDSLHLVERLPRLEDARAAAQRRRDRLGRGAGSTLQPPPRERAGAVAARGTAAANTPRPGVAPARTLSGYGPARYSAAAPPTLAAPARAATGPSAARR